MPSDEAGPTDCAGIEDLLDAHADGELPPATAAMVQAHLAGCPACAADLAATRALRADLAGLRRDTAPAALRRRLEAALPRLPVPPPRRRLLEAMAAGVVGLVLGGGGMALTVAGGLVGADSRPGDLAAHDLLAAHARALLAEAPPQVTAGDPHRVRPWLSARLPVSPRVEEPEGYPLLGARLDLVAGEPVAAVLYRRREHAITVFATAAARSPGWPVRDQTQQGFNLLPWSRDGVRYLAVSDLGMVELSALRHALGGP